MARCRHRRQGVLALLGAMTGATMIAAGGAAASPGESCRDPSLRTGGTAFNGCNYEQFPFALPLLAPVPGPAPDPIPPYIG
ncbi:hypothetical protein [Aestuariivirga litoralis]|nr:hypothetical protein [Aestuariivirga litoralis]